MHDYEKLGTLFLGRHHDPAADTTVAAGDAVLCDCQDLTTHAVIIGMTGSGKTGLGVGLIEKAAVDFEPWVDPQQAATRGRTRRGQHDRRRAESESTTALSAPGAKAPDRLAWRGAVWRQHRRVR